MPATQRSPEPVRYHRVFSPVCLEKYEDELISLTLSARKQRSAPKGQGEQNLRRDIRRKAARPYYHILKLAFADMRDGENVADVVRALRAAIDMITTYASPDPDRSMAAWIQIETDIEGAENSLEVAYLSGDHSHSTLVQLDEKTREHIADLEKLRSAIHHELYSEAA